MIIVIGSIRFAPGSIDALRPHLAGLAEGTRAEEGCLSYEIAEDVFDPGVVRFAETWRDQAALSAHGRQPHIAVWRAATAGHAPIDRRFTVYDGDNPRPL